MNELNDVKMEKKVRYLQEDRQHQKDQPNLVSLKVPINRS